MTLDELEKLEKAATPGPWEHKGPGGYVCFMSCINGQPDDWVSAPSSPGMHLSKPDAQFIVAAREMLPKLIKALKIAKLGTQRQAGWIDVEVALAALEQP